MRARVAVTLKSGILDPQGKAIEGALDSLGVTGIVSVRQGKIFDVELLSDDPVEAEASLRKACEKLLANTVIENFRVEIEGAWQRRKTGAPAAADAQEAAAETAEDAAAAAEMPAEGHP